MYIRSSCLRVLVAGLLAITSFAAHGDGDAATQEPASESGWTVVAAPYLWAAALEGTLGQPRLPPLDVDASFGDIVEHLDMALMGVVEVRKDRLGLFSDVQYVRLSTSAETPAGIAATGTEVTATTATLLAAGTWRALEGSGHSLDLMAGLRGWHTTTEIAFTGGLLNGRSSSQTESWVDPMAGLRGRYDLTGHLFAMGWAMYGGFGLASQSSWDLMAGLGYEIGDRMSLVAGYRSLAVDYSTDGFIYDVVQSGPLLGLSYRF